MKFSIIQRESGHKPFVIGQMLLAAFLINYSVPSFAAGKGEYDWDKSKDSWDNEERDQDFDPHHQGKGSGGAETTISNLNDISHDLMAGLEDAFEACARMALHGGGSSECTFKNMGTTRSPNANFGAKNSCHKNTPSDAIDVGAITCGGSTMDPQQNHDRYDQFVQCVANGTGRTAGDSSTNLQGKGLVVIYRQGVAASGNLRSDSGGKHEDHAHIMVPGCSYNGGGGKGEQK